jgi:hypothetical protein
MHRILLLAGLLFMVSQTGIRAQHLEFGVTWTPVQVNKITFDKQNIVFSDYTSVVTGHLKFSPSPYALTLSNAGLFLRYINHWYFIQAEASYLTNYFLYSHRKVNSDYGFYTNNYFHYSAVEIPLTAGVRINREHTLRFRIYGGLNNEFGRNPKKNFFSLFTVINHKNDSINPEIISRYKSCVIYAVAGFSVDYFSTGFSLRLEKNITDLNRNHFEFNANFKDCWLIRFTISMTIPTKRTRQKETS